MHGFNRNQDLRVVGADNERGRCFLANVQPSNSEGVVVYLYEPEAVYPYHGNYRIYPEHMLEEAAPKKSCFECLVEEEVAPKKSCFERLVDWIVAHG